MNRLLVSVFWVLLTLTSLPSVLAQESDWPRTLPLEKGMVTIYTLQVDKMSDDIIHFRAALAYRATANSEPVFGAGWFESRVEIDSTNRIVHPTDLKVTETRFPAGTDDVQAELSNLLAQQSPVWNLDFSLDELEAALKTAEAEARAVQNLNTAPPRIIYRDHPALLVSLDGEPVLREIENSPHKAVINTPYPLIYNGKYYFLNAAKDVWYRANKATGPYHFETNPPLDIAAMVNANESETAGNKPVEPITAANAPEIVVSTEPAELIVTDGPAAFIPLVDDLLVLQNSDDDVFMHVSSQDFYIVLAGRWYHASSLDGPWVYQQADKLPKAFASIPRNSNQADSRVYVAGTEEAREAVLDAQVPQTAAVKRGEVDITVEYDGEPIYQPVDGTDLVYIENTGSTVLQSDGLYYLVENGVWYVSSSPNGPWQVSDHRPERVSSILPTSPVYNVKYVHVYDSTPSVVYVGYTPGYTGSYVYGNTIFYGSGWYYPPWVSPYYYYPRYSSWGFSVRYSMWYGWNFGLSWGWGPFSFGYYSGGYWHHNHYWHHRHYGRWGPGRYRHRPGHHGYRSYGHNRYAGNGRHDDYRGRDNANGGYRDSGRNANGGQRDDNLYRDGSQRARVTDTRDNQPRMPDRRNNDTRQVNYSGTSGRRQQNYTGLKKGERNRAVPVKSSDLRLKADVRDVNYQASRGRLLADNSGNVYRGVERSWASGKTGTGRTTRPDTGFSPRQSQARLADNRARARSSEVVRSSVRQPQEKTRKNSARQRSSRDISAPRQKQNTSRANPQPKASRNSGRNNSGPAQNSQSSSRSNPGPAQSSRNSGRSNSAPTQSAPQRSTQKSSVKRSRSNGGGKRGRDNRSRDA